MGWNWRKSFNFGLLKINMSKKGVGYSLGIRGFRVGKNAKGQQYTQTSIPGTGVYKRDYSGTSANGRNWIVPLLLAIFLILAILRFLFE
jgi:hypothetical protein